MITHEEYTTECLVCDINVSSTYLEIMDMDNDTAVCLSCFARQLWHTPLDSSLDD
jgi:hypothetical protein